MKTRQAYICEPVRTPVGKFGGAYKPVDAQFLGAAVLRGSARERPSFPAAAVEDVLFAQCYSSMEAPALGRVVALDAGLPVTVPAGSSSIDAAALACRQLIYAYLQVATGGSDVVIAGGAESMSNAPFFTHRARWGIKGAVA